MSQPIISIVIATRNRASFCIKTIETILKIVSPDFEIIVQDNSDDDDLENYIKTKISDSRLIFNKSNQVLSFVGNFNMALSFANGYYVTAIGDDDGVNPKIIDVAKYAMQNKLESLGSAQSCEYYWPNVIEDHKNGCVLIPSFNCAISSYDPKKRLIPLLISGIVNYIPFNFPRLYHGIIRRDLLDKIKNKNGDFLRGLSPDIYSSIALSTIIKKHTLIDYPFIISGVCSESGAAASVNSKHCGNLEDAPHFRGNNDYKWEPEIPKYYCVETIWAETALKAVKDQGRSDLLKYFNIYFLVAQSIFKNPNIRKLIFEQCQIMLKSENKSIGIFKLKVFSILLALNTRILINKIYQKITNKSESRRYYPNVADIGEATSKLESELESNPLYMKYDFNIT